MEGGLVKYKGPQVKRGHLLACGGHTGQEEEEEMPELCLGTVFLQWLLREAGSQESISLLWRLPGEPVSRLGAVAAAPGPPKASDLC